MHCIAGARFTFAVKMAPSKEIAYEKSLVLDIDPLSQAWENADEQEAKRINQIFEDIKAGRLNEREIENIVSQYEGKPASREALIGLID